jgi:Leucine-rich repeat (LRR) protein/peroxiredoxin family protein
LHGFGYNCGVYKNYYKEDNLLKKLISISIIGIMLISIFIPVYCEDEMISDSISEKKIIKFADSNLEAAIRTIINKPVGNILVDEVKDIKKLHASNKNISSLEGIEYLRSLQELLLKENNISDITPISELKNLRYLNLWKNNINDITPLKDITNLQQLDLDSNKITDIDSLKGLTNLRALRLGSNKLTDISPIHNLTNLEYLCLWSNHITNIEPLIDLEGLTELRLPYNEIQDIAPLANLKKLQTLNLNNNNIRDINPLSELTNLKALYMINNNVRNIDSLNNLKNMERLRFDDNHISTAKGLETLNNLKFLTLSKNQISDITSLKGMKKLEVLDLKNNRLMNIQVLSELNSLEKLFLDGNSIYNIISLSDNQKLITLSLSNNYLWDTRPLGLLVNLKYLNLSNNNIDNIESLKHLSSLRDLYVGHNHIEDIEGLKENTELKNLSIEDNNITRLDSITGLINLETLNMADNQVSDISYLNGNTNLKVLKIYDNPISDFSPLYELNNLEIIRTIDYKSPKAGITVEGSVTDFYNDQHKGSDTYITMIDLYGQNNKLTMDVTDEHGEFKIQGVFPGEYKIVFTKRGYKPLIMHRTIDLNNNEINAKLELDSQINWASKETERTVYNYKDGMEISDVEIVLQEKRLMEIEKFFDIKIKDKVNFYICTYPEEIYELAYDTKDYYALGTYKSSTNSLYTIGKAFDFHETCHVVEYGFNPNYNLPLGEGLAVYFGNYNIGFPMALNRPVDDLARELMIKGELKDIQTLFKGFNKGNDYIANGSLVTFLLKNYSHQQFKDLFKSLPNKPTQENIEGVFMTIYNKSTKEIQNEWLSYLKGRIN